MKVSIITINKNQSVGLRKTITSVIEQTYENIEYIIIDGESEDDSKEVIKEFSEKIDFWICENDSGIYNAMNKGIEKASGHYCMFLNSGDFLSNQSVIENLIKDGKGESIIYGNLMKVFPDGTKRLDKNNAGRPITMLSLFMGTINHSGTLIKRELFQKFGQYDESLTIVSDWKFFLVAVGIHNESVGYIDLMVSEFNMEGISNTNKQLELSERQKVLRSVLPASVYNDYKNQAVQLSKLQRIQRYNWARWFLWFIERLLFKYEKLTKQKNYK